MTKEDTMLAIGVLCSTLPEKERDAVIGGLLCTNIHANAKVRALPSDAAIKAGATLIDEFCEHNKELFAKNLELARKVVLKSSAGEAGTTH